MKLSARKLVVLIMALMVSSIAIPAPETKNIQETIPSNNHIAQLGEHLNQQSMLNQQNAQRMAATDFFATFTRGINECAQQLDITLENIALDLHHDAVKVTDKKAVLTSVMQFRKFLGQVKNSPFLNASLEELLYTIAILESMNAHIALCIEQGFDTIINFSPKKSVDLPEQITPDLLMNLVQSLKQSIDTLDQKAQNIGLTWYNKAFRGAGSAIVNACDTYNIPAWAALGGVVAAGAFACWYLSPAKTPESLRNFFGEQPTFDLTKSGGKPTNPESVKWLGNLHWGYSLIAAPLSVTLSIANSIPLSKDISGKNLNLTQLTIKKVGNLVSAVKTFFTGAAHRNRQENKKLVTFDDIVGCEHAKEVMRPIVKYLEDPVRFARQGLTPERGFLFYGDSRTGKSHFAKAFSGEVTELYKRLGKPSPVPFYEVSTNTIIKNGIGRVLEYYKQMAPCVLFIEEIDLLGLQRVGQNSLLAEFLYTLSGINDEDPNKQIILIANTNRPENIDFALRQKGRFGSSIYFEYPTFENRLTFLLKEFTSLGLDYEEFDLPTIAQAADGCSYEDLRSVITAAFTLAKTKGTTLNQELLEECIDSQIYRIQKNHDNRLSEKEMSIVATHQAGIAVAHKASMVITSDITRVTVEPVLLKHKEVHAWVHLSGNDKNKQESLSYGKVFTTHKHNHSSITNNETELEECVVALAGSAAEEIILGSSGSNYNHTARKDVYERIKRIVFNGISPDEFSKDRRDELLKAAETTFDTSLGKARAIMQEHKELVQSIAQALIEKKNLNAAELKAIMSPQPTTASATVAAA